MKRKSIPAFIMILVICTGLYNPAGAAQNNPYRDVPSDKWYYEDVQRAYELGIMKGVGDDCFAPDEVMTREMFVTALYRMAQIGDVGENAFLIKYDDVNYKSAGKWYYLPVAWATDMGVTLGVDENTFGIGMSVTRQQIAAFIYRYLNNRFISINVPKSDTPAAEFTDMPAGYARDAIDFMRLTGIVNGMGGNKFEPKAQATRAQVAAMLCRLYDVIKNASYKFNFETERYTEIRLTTISNGQSNISSVTDKSEIIRALEYINTIEIETARDDESVYPYEYGVALFDGSRNDPVFIFGITDTGSVRHNGRVYETDKLIPLLQLYG